MELLKGKIAHISDIHIRLATRHDEYKIVFNRLYKDLQKEAPRRIVLTGDLFHQKIDMQPHAIDLAASFLSHLSEVAPVDIILGNHDMNEAALDQGNTIKPILDLMPNGFIITKDTVKDGESWPLPESGNGIYLYMDSGFYNVEKDVVYGVYSMWDNQMLSLQKKEEDKVYVALYHGQIYGYMTANGLIMKDDDLIPLSTFDNFDMVMLGDIHEHQAFERNGKEDVAYSGSLCQNSRDESQDKGYFIWDLATCTFTRRFILNDYGMCPIHISKGEDIYERIESSIKLSFNPKKTKIYIELEDDAENENAELKSQVKKYVKTKYGCESVQVEFKRIFKDKVLGVSTDNIDLTDKMTFRELLRNWLIENEYDNVDDVLELSDETDKTLNLLKNFLNYVEWDILDMTTCNLFSHPAEITHFPIGKMNGLIGIFGVNYSGKSNVIRALVWILYGKILNGGESHSAVNFYTGVNHAEGTIIFKTPGDLYKIERGIKVTFKKDGTPIVKNSIDYSYAIRGNDDEVIDWIPEKSDRGVKEKPELKKMIEDAIGTFDNFTKVSLQTQGGKDDYLSLQQQPKNDLIREYLNLKPCDDRYELVKKKFNQNVNTQKSLGDIMEIEKKIEDATIKIGEETKIAKDAEKAKSENDKQIERHNDEKLEFVKTLIKIEKTGDLSADELKTRLLTGTAFVTSLTNEIRTLEEWFVDKFKKYIPEGLESLNVDSLKSEVETEKKQFQIDKNEYTKLEAWLKENPKKQESSAEMIQEARGTANDIAKLLVKLHNELAIAKGEICPTCKNPTKEANPKREQELVGEIEDKNKEQITLLEHVSNEQKIVEENLKIEKQENKLEALKNKLKASKLNASQLSETIIKLSTLEGDIKHNTEFESNTKSLSDKKKTLEKSYKVIEMYEKDLETITKNAGAVILNEEINDKIKKITESINSYKIQNIALAEKSKSSYGIVSVQKSNIEKYTEDLEKIKEADKKFKKYSAYLQAVGRDGIPMQIIKKRLPVINYKISSIIKNIGNFKIEMLMKSNGDVQEILYFKDDKSDARTMSLASGSQKFIGSIAIRDALHYISCLIKPSFCIIDEGFGTLDEKNIGEIGNALAYLRGKYKKVFIVTHDTRVKDYAEHVIYVNKTINGTIMTPEEIEAMPDFGISKFSFT